jgi:hypothetical protein
MISIPSNLAEALQELESQLSDEDKEKIQDLGEDEFVTLSHMFIGQKLRNLWLYPKDSPLYEFFNAEGLFHEDDMSDIILRSFYRHLRNEDIRYEEMLEGKVTYKALKIML